MPTYSNATPGTTEILATSQGLMLANFQYLQTDLSVDHNFTTNTATAADGYHKVIHFVNQGSDPSVVANIGQLYTKTVGGTQQLFYMNGAGAVAQLSATATTAATNGTASLLGGIIIQWGTFTGLSGLNSVNFTGVGGLGVSNFPNNCFFVIANISRSTASSTPQTVFCGNFSASGFTYVNTASAAPNLTFSWMAIGN